MTFVIDIDDTIIKVGKINCEKCGRVNYETSKPFVGEIDRINRLYQSGNIIMLWTSRGWDYYEKTKEQLTVLGVQYHELIMGRPQGVFIDKDSFRNIEDYVNQCHT